MTIIHNLSLYGATAIVFCAMTGLGAVPERFFDPASRPSRFVRVALRAISGWGLVAFVSAVGAVPNIDQTWLVRGLLALGLVLLVPVSRKRRTVQIELLGSLALLFVAVAPMGLLIADAPATAYDEFAQWLPNARHLVERAHYWVWPDWDGGSVRPGYPNASIIVPLLVSQLVGSQVEAPLKIFVVILIGAYGGVLADLASARWFPDIGRPWTARALVIALLAGGCAIAFLDPFIDPRISFTSLTDTPTAIVLAVSVLAATHGIENARRGANPIAWFAWTGLVSLTLVLLRETNLVLVGAVDLACVVLLFGGKVDVRRLWIRWALVLIVPPAAGKLIWETYLKVAEVGLPMQSRPLSEWDWSAPLTLAKVFVLDRLIAHPLRGGMAIAAVGVGIVGGLIVCWRLDRSFDEKLPSPRFFWSVTAIVILCFVALLAWAYIAVNQSADASGATGLWRYLTELGPTVVLAGFCTILAALPAHRLGLCVALLSAGLGIGALLVLPVYGRGYFRPDCHYPEVVAARDAGARFRPTLERLGAKVGVLHPTMADWLAYAIAYDLRWPISGGRIQSRASSKPLGEAENWAWDGGFTALLDLRPLDRALLRSDAPAPAVSLLGRPAARGEPWPVLAIATPRLPPCSIW